MKPEEQRIAIAEACGWTVITDFVNLPLQIPAKTAYYRKGFKMYPAPPDYLNDLNAMHEAEKVLDDRDDLFDIYRAELYKIMPKEFSLPDRKRWNGCATAAQRAEAFLKTLNLWKP